MNKIKQVRQWQSDHFHLSCLVQSLSASFFLYSNMDLLIYSYTENEEREESFVTVLFGRHPWIKSHRLGSSQAQAKRMCGQEITISKLVHCFHTGYTHTSMRCYLNLLPMAKNIAHKSNWDYLEIGHLVSMQLCVLSDNIKRNIITKTHLLIAFALLMLSFKIAAHSTP